MYYPTERSHDVYSHVTKTLLACMFLNLSLAKAATLLIVFSLYLLFFKQYLSPVESNWNIVESFQANDFEASEKCFHLANNSRKTE